MKRLLLLATLLLAINSLAYAAGPRVQVDTSMGSFVLQLDQEKAPKTVANFLAYVKSGFYSNTLFHRVIDNFMIQGGGFTPNYKLKPTNPPILNEANNGLKNNRGTIAMARTPDPQSASSQFFINVKDNDFLNYTSATPRGWGYAVFGRVIKGMNVVDKIRKVRTGAAGIFPQDAPQPQVLIKKMTLLGDNKGK